MCTELPECVASFPIFPTAKQGGVVKGTDTKCAQVRHGVAKHVGTHEVCSWISELVSACVATMAVRYFATSFVK